MIGGCQWLPVVVSVSVSVVVVVSCPVLSSGGAGSGALSRGDLGFSRGDPHRESSNNPKQGKGANRAKGLENSLYI